MVEVPVMFQPSLQFLLRDQALLTFILFRSGPLAPIVKLLVGDPSGLDPRKAPLVFLAVSLESVIVCLSERPLLQSADVAAALLPFRNGPLAILRTDPPGLRKPSPAVLAAPHSDVPLHAASQRVVDHVPDAGGIQHRRTPPRLHRLKSKQIRANSASEKRSSLFKRSLFVFV